MQQEERSMNEVLVECVAAAGGAKMVGTKLWPEKLVDHAHRALLDALNDERPHHLKPEQVMLIAALARSAGCHAYMHYCAARLHYQPPVPRAPRDEMAELQRSFIDALALQQRLVQQMQALQADAAHGALRAVG